MTDIKNTGGPAGGAFDTKNTDQTGYTPASWRKSSFCENSGCVEVADMPGAVAVRDSESPEGGLLVFMKPVWAQFIAGVKAGEFG